MVLTIALSPRLAGVAFADGGITATSQVSQTTVEVDQPFTLSLELDSDDSIGGVTGASFDPPPGVTVRGPSFSMQERTTFVNGVATRVAMARVTYTLVASAPGKITLRSPTAVARGRSWSGQAVTVEVVAAGTGPGSGATPGPSPFFFPTPGGSLVDPFAQRDDEDAPSAKDLELQGVPDEDVFLHATLDKNEVVVGEQVTYSVYLYFRVSYEMSERSDPKYADFLRFPILTDPGSTKSVYTRVNDKRYGARLVERVALIPLRAGKLHVGTMSARVKGRQIGSGVLRQSNDVEVDAVEPPTTGRPAGYVLGDVGQYALTASVSPRKINQGGSISVSVRVEGVGNVPSEIKPPDVAGAEWLTPHRKDDLTIKDGKVAGSRTLEYVVRMDRAGKVDLGTLELPYYDPTGKRYEVAKVALGQVDVQATAPSDADLRRAQKNDGEDPLSQLPGPHKKLAAFAPARPPTLPRWALWAGVAAPPALALFVLGLGRARRASDKRKNAPEAAARAKLKEALAQAKATEKSQDVKAHLGAVERAIHTSIEIGTGIKSRGLRLDEIAGALTARGVAAQFANEAAALLSECDSLRFAPEGGDLATKELHARALKLTKRLVVDRRSSPPAGEARSSKPAQ
jgi:hypothetical protein